MHIERAEKARNSQANTQQQQTKIVCPNCNTFKWVSVIHGSEYCQTCGHTWQPTSAVL